MFKLPSLQDFQPEPEPEEAAGPSAEFEAGLAEGLARSAQDIRLAEARALDALTQSLSDISFTYAEARLRVLEALRPLFEELAATILPHAVEASLISRLHHLLQETAAIDTSTGLQLLAHPETSKWLASHPSLHIPQAISLAADPRVPTDKLLLRSSSGGTALDISALRDAINDALLYPLLPLTEASQNDTFPLGTSATQR